MCGICGTIRFDGEPVEERALRRSLAAMRHRGPDQEGSWIDNKAGAGLGAVRLCVLDPRPDAHQPFHDETGRFHLVFNGEVYNYVNIRRELTGRGHRFRTESDTEVVLHACVQWGTGALSRFNGMWALAFIDAVERIGFLARDRFGIKPLLYATTGRAFHFASEVQAARRLGGFDRTLDADALRQHLCFGFIAHPHTIYRGLQRLPPAHFLRFACNGTGPDDVHEPERYYELPSTVPTSTDEYAELCARTRQRLGDAVARRKVAHVPLGALLSGGLDSSIVAYHLASVSSQRIRTYCVGYEGHTTYDESRYARLVAERLGADHHNVVVTPREVVDALPFVLDRLGEPVGDSSILPVSLVSRAAREDLTVALSGDGGDELFGGYWRYLGHHALRTYAGLPRFLRKGLIEPAVGRLSASRSSKLGNRVRQVRKLLRATSDDMMNRHLSWARILDVDAESVFTDPRSASAAERSLLEQGRAWIAAGRGDGLSRVLAFDLGVQLPSDMLNKVDLAGMMHSLEVRVPFLDHALVEHAMAVPSRFKIDRGLRKRLLIDAYRGRLPDEVLDRPKQGFEVPFGELIRGPLVPALRDVVTRNEIESIDADSGVELSYPAIVRVIDQHTARRADHSDLIFALISLCWWRRCRFAQSVT